jgi:hypothetical protein
MGFLTLFFFTLVLPLLFFFCFVFGVLLGSGRVRIALWLLVFGVVCWLVFVVVFLLLLISVFMCVYCSYYLYTLLPL